jgi:hypothetical protein
MTQAQKIIDWLAEHPNSLSPEIERGATLRGFAGSYLKYLTKNGTLIRTGKKPEFRYRLAEKSDHPPAQSNGIPAAFGASETPTVVDSLLAIARSLDRVAQAIANLLLEDE